uniref:Clusterin-associated protein 1 n=1 Tax=Heterorhabditis bacteriophora TaxID=37862 RepID=A0A1I7X3S7_HETBA
MSSTSSISSSNDADFIVDSRIPPTIRRDIERFSVFINRLRSVLDVNTNVPDGESVCVSVHAALEMVSESMRDLFKYPQFKTNHVILPSLQLVQSVKEIAFERTKLWSKLVELFTFLATNYQIFVIFFSCIIFCYINDIPPFMPLREVFENSFDCDNELVSRMKETTDHLKDRVVEALDARRKDHDAQRGMLKLEWTKLTKSLKEDAEKQVTIYAAELRQKRKELDKSKVNPSTSYYYYYYYYYYYCYYCYFYYYYYIFISIGFYSVMLTSFFYCFTPSISSFFYLFIYCFIYRVVSLRRMSCPSRFHDSNLMGPSNLSTVIAPSLIWHPPFTTTDHSAAISDAQHTNKAVEVVIRHAYAIFGVDRTADWQDFFSTYSIEEPPKDEDLGNVSDDEDINDDDGIDHDIDDDDQMFIPQPPTPDLLKSTRKSEIKHENRASSWQGTPEEQKRRTFEPKIKTRDKRRSYTTSILISPHVERPTLVGKQKSMEEDTALNLCSGDVTLDISKGQFFLDRNHDGKVIQRRQSNKGAKY